MVHTWRSLYDPEMVAEPESRVTREMEAQPDGFSNLALIHDRLEVLPEDCRQPKRVVPGTHRKASTMKLTLTHHKTKQEGASHDHDPRPRRLTSTLLWVAQILLAVFFIFGAAVPKLTGSHQMVQEFGLIGAGQWLRYLVGTTELAGAIGLLIPWLAGPAAAGLAADMAGATITNATVLHNTTFGVNVWMTALLCAVFVVLAYSRREQIKGLAAGIRQ